MSAFHIYGQKYPAARQETSVRRVRFGKDNPIAACCGPFTGRVVLLSMKKALPCNQQSRAFSGDPWENRTPVCGVRGRRLDRLTNGPCKSIRANCRSHTAAADTHIFTRIAGTLSKKEKEPAPSYPPGSFPTKYFRHDRA